MKSNIGDMWKCARYLKNRFEDDGKFVEFINLNVNGKFSYLVCYPVITDFRNFAFLNLNDTEELHKKILSFNVEFKHFVVKNGNNILYGISIM